LSRALKTSDTRLALQKLNGLTIGKVLDAREKWFDVKRELDSKRKWVKELEEEIQKPKEMKSELNKKDIKALMKSVREDVDRLELKLSKTVYLPMLAELRRQNEEELLDILQLLIIEVVKFYHTSEKMSDPQIFETSFLIANTFAGLTLEDVALCFHKAKAGDFGTVYNRIDGPVILDWLHKYQDKMQAVGMERELQRHLQSKGSTWKHGADYRINAINATTFEPSPTTKAAKPLKDLL